MASVYSRNLQILTAEQFKAAVEDSSQPFLYFTIGKIDSWPNDNAPPQANSSVLMFNDVWKNMIGAKKVQGNDVRLGIRRNNWTSGTVYNEYDDTLITNDPNVKPHVVTEEWNVYKCLSNNNGSISTVKPTSISTSSPQITTDNYVWKYMYTLTDEERLRFTTEEFIPVRTLTEDNGSLQWSVQQNAKAGSIESVRVLNGGSNYTTTPLVTITGDGTGAEAIARVNTTTKVVEGVTITNKGLNYTFANVVFSSASGSGAVAKAMISPTGGHGSNPVEELGGSHLIINVQVRGTEGNVLDVENEFRQVAIIKNPIVKSTKAFAANLVYSQTTTVYVDANGSDYEEDEIVFQGADVEQATFKGRIASWKPSESKLELIDVTGVPRSGIISGNTSKTSREYLSFIDRDLEPYTGSLLYIDNIKPIQRASDQTEDFKIVLTF